MTPASFVQQLCAVSLENVFNPYADRCGVHDLKNAPALRARSLGLILDVAAHRGVDAIWIGRDLGYRGGRRTGLALTDDVHLGVHSSRWGVEASRPTTGEVIKERTAAVIWGSLQGIPRPIFLWNVFPFHPHEPGEPFSNRAHTNAERKIGEEILWELIRLLRPGRIVAIGNDAARTMSTASITAYQVRHPSYGGQAQFSRQIRELYGLDMAPELAHAAEFRRY
ncbi:MAG TPA: uracil-DNA glycosylase [Rhizomicrobium sp.]|nr:uracil-DNA glycosylase [Rhizomicrobium sp.]